MFSAKDFMRAEFQPRTKDVEVPELQAFFTPKTGTFDTPKESAIWQVRGVTANELARARDAKTKNQNVAALATALTHGSSDEKVNALRDAFGYGNDVHHEVAYRLELLTMGSVDPECPLDMAVRLAERFPVTFWMLSSSILDLTGQGQEDATKKPKPSGKTQKSEPAST